MVNKNIHPEYHCVQISLLHKSDLIVFFFCTTETALKMTQRGTINVTALNGIEIVGIAVNRIKGQHKHKGAKNHHIFCVVSNDATL